MSMKELFLTWFKAARAPFLIVSIIPVLLATAMAAYDGYFDFKLFLVALIGVVMAHSAADFIDDYFDYKTGNLGNKNKQFHDSPLIDKKVTLPQIVAAIMICLIVVVMSAGYIFMRVGFSVVWIVLCGLFIVFFYTSPPLKLNYRGLGETMLFVAFGPMIVMGVYYVFLNKVSFESFLVSVPLGIFTMNVGLVSNIFDFNDDVLASKKTIPVRFGRDAAIRVLLWATVFAYVSVAVGIIIARVPVATSVCFLTLPLAFSVIRLAKQYANVSFYTKAMTYAIMLTSLMGLLLFSGYCIALAVRK